MDDPSPSTVPELRSAVLQAWAAVRPRMAMTLVERVPRHVHDFLAVREVHTKVFIVWCKHDEQIHKQYGHMPFGFISSRRYLHALSLHCRVALTLLFVILKVAEPIRDWILAILSTVVGIPIKVVS